MNDQIMGGLRLGRMVLGLAAALCLASAAAQSSAPTLPSAGDPPPKLNIAQELGLSGRPSFGSEKHVSLSASFTVEQGSHRGTLTVSARIDSGWHIYSITQQKGATLPSKITVADSPDYKLLGAFQADREPNAKTYSFYRVPVEEHEGQVTWSAPFEFSEGVKPEPLSIQIHYSGQVCKDACQQVDENLAASFAGYTAPPQTPGEYRPNPSQAQVTFKGHIEPPATSGGKAKLVITATPNPGWHVYANAPKDQEVVGANKPTLIHLAPLPGWSRSSVKTSREPKVKPPTQAGLPEERYHEEPVTWTIELSPPVDSPTGETVLTGYLGFQTCKNNDGGCLPPQAVQFRAAIPAKTATHESGIPLEFVAVKPPGADASTETSRSIDAAAVALTANIGSYRDVAKLAAASPAPAETIKYAGLLPIVGFGLLGGLILNLMPCVLPVIGLKLLSFIQQGGQSRAKIFALNLWFALGLLAVFLVLATLAAFGSLIPYLGQNLAWGQQFTYTEFKVAMVVIVFAFALSFLGVWEVPIPGFAQSSASSKLQQHEGPAGAFFKGVFTTLLATPCSGPFLGPVFAYTLAQPPLATYIIFGSVGVGMALPYLVIGAFPSLVRWLPKPGAWMETFKQLMGFVLLGTVVYLFATISADYFISTLALVMGVWFACWIIGRVPIYEPAIKQLWAWISGCAAAAIVGYLAFTFLGPAKHLYEWKAYSPDSIAKMQSEGKTVMVDFTADWCPTCQANFIFAINTPRVKEAVEKNGVVPMLADWSDYNVTIKAKLAELNSNSIPLLAIYPAGKPGEVIVLPDLLVERQVLTALEQAGPSNSANPAGKASAETAMAPQPSG
jgi:thiol:disulfide interchange protein